MVDSWGVWVGLASLVSVFLFAAINLSLRLPSRARIATQFEKRGKKRSFERFVARRADYILTTAVVRSVAEIALIVCVLADFGVFAQPLDSTRLVAACGTALILIIVFGVAIPTAWAKYSGDRLIVAVEPSLSVLRVVLAPIAAPLAWFDPVVRRLAGVPIRDAQSYADELEQEILDVVSEGERLGAVDEEEKEMIESVIELSDTRVEEIMTPRTEMVGLAARATLDEVLETIRSKGHSRIPVYEDTIDKILGMLYAKDLLRRDMHVDFVLTDIMRKPLFIPETKHVRELLREFQAEKVHIAVVLDEYGGTAGLVTIEDILEELVGEITDEYETVAPAELKRIDDVTVEVDGKMRIDELNDELNIELPEDEDYETIGGFVFSTLGKIPVVGEQCRYKNLGIDVIAAEARRVTRLRLTIDHNVTGESSEP